MSGEGVEAEDVEAREVYEQTVGVVCKGTGIALDYAAR